MCLYKEQMIRGLFLATGLDDEDCHFTAEFRLKIYSEETKVTCQQEVTADGRTE